MHHSDSQRMRLPSPRARRRASVRFPGVLLQWFNFAGKDY
jgi:hypothetical protein